MADFGLEEIDGYDSEHNHLLSEINMAHSFVYVRNLILDAAAKLLAEQPRIWKLLFPYMTSKKIQLDMNGCCFEITRAIMPNMPPIYPIDCTS